MVYVWMALPASNHAPSFSVGNVHASLTSRMDGSMVFYNQKSPYMGSIISFAGDKAVSEWGVTGWGVYFRHIENTVEKSVWRTLIISLWYPVILFGILPALFAIEKTRAKILR